MALAEMAPAAKRVREVLVNKGRWPAMAAVVVRAMMMAASLRHPRKLVALWRAQTRAAMLYVFLLSLYLRFSCGADRLIYRCSGRLA